MNLALRALGLGDFLTGVPALRALVDALGAPVVLAAPAALRPLVRLVDGVSLLPWRGLDDRGSVSEPVETAVNLHGRGPQSHALLASLAPRRMLGFDWPGGPRWLDGEHEVHRWCRLLEHYGIPADPSRLALVPPARAVPAIAVGATLIHPGAASPARRWPASRFAAVARAEVAAGRRVVVTGGADETALADEVARPAGLGPEHVLAGTTDLADLAALVAAAGRVVCGDTGVAHLATALDTPSVVLFGPTDPAEWGPPPSERHRVLWAGRRGDPHGTRPDPGLLAIEADQVIEALAR